jgi:hypothetical protein
MALVYSKHTLQFQNLKKIIGESRGQLFFYLKITN